MDHSKSESSAEQFAPALPRIPEGVLYRAWNTDPYISDPVSINATISQFFAHVEETMIVRFLPQKVFTAWVASSVDRKSTDDLMLLYSVLAVGVALSGGSKRIAHEYAQVAQYAQRLTTVQSLQLGQTRILLAVYHASSSRLSECNEIMNAAAGTAACLQLNLEVDHPETASVSDYPFGMNKAAYCESRRRTLWSLFLLERLTGLFPARPTMMDAEDIYVRLVDDLDGFEKQMDSRMPLFDPYEYRLPKTAEQSLDVRSYLVEVVHLWSSCQTAIYRSARRPQPSKVDSATQGALLRRLQDWSAGLPAHLIFSDSNMEAAAHVGSASALLVMHLLYNHAMIRLNRYQHGARDMPANTRAHHYRRCCHYANNILDIAQCLERCLKHRPATLRIPPSVLVSMMTEAVDVLSARGAVSHLAELVDNIHLAKAVMEVMGRAWGVHGLEDGPISKRLQKLLQIRNRRSWPPSPAEGYQVVQGSQVGANDKEAQWQINDSIDTLCPRAMDIVYNHGSGERRTFLPS